MALSEGEILYVLRLGGEWIVRAPEPGSAAILFQAPAKDAAVEWASRYAAEHGAVVQVLEPSGENGGVAGSAVHEESTGNEDPGSELT
jgi:hypothetical protein